MENQKAKQLLRLAMKKVRENLSAERKKQAADQFTSNWINCCTGLTLSYASFGSELSTLALNQWLAARGLLVLPKIDQNTLKLYQVPVHAIPVSNTFTEIDPALCCEVDSSHLSCALIPGLAFDNTHARLGFGKGYYDRFLLTLPRSIVTVGIGFEEQLVDKIPQEAHDALVKKIYLY